VPVRVLVNADTDEVERVVAFPEGVRLDRDWSGHFMMWKASHDPDEDQLLDDWDHLKKVTASEEPQVLSVADHSPGPSWDGLLAASGISLPSPFTTEDRKPHGPDCYCPTCLDPLRRVF